MTISTTDGVHFLLLTADLWTDVPTVVGIFTTDAGAVEAAHSAMRSAEAGTQRFTLEEWNGTLQRTSTTIIDPNTNKL